MALPPGFIPLSAACDASANTIVDVIGVVVDMLPPGTTRTGEFIITFRLTDDSLANGYTSTTELKVRMFKKTEAEVPKVRNVGDVVLLRQAKITCYKGQCIALGTWATSCLVFPGPSIPEPNYAIGYASGKSFVCHGLPGEVQQVTTPERQYVCVVKKETAAAVAKISARLNPNSPAAVQYNLQPAEETPSLRRSYQGLQNIPTGPALKKQKTSSSIFGQKFRLIEELQPKQFADICGQVIKCIPTQYGDCDLYITDYTENESVRYYPAPEENIGDGRDGDTFGYVNMAKKAWPGPYGYLILKVNLKSPHAQFANQFVREKDFVLLSNVKTRITPTGNWLEGDMWHDDRDKQAIKVQKLSQNTLDSSPEVERLLQRKQRYWAEREGFVKGKTASDGDASSKNKPPGNSKRARQRQRRARDKQAQLAAGDKASHSSGDDAGVTRQNPKSNATLQGGINNNVRCKYPDVPITSVQEILDLTNARHSNISPDGHSQPVPFINAQYRAKVRVVDYEPKSLVDFAKSIEEYRNDRRVDDDPNEHSMEWEPSNETPATPQLMHWNFALQLEDASVTNSRKQPAATLKDTQPVSPFLQHIYDSAHPNRMWVHVRHDEAQFLFGNGIDDPTDLSEQRAMLAKVREKLFVLWGNLEEISQSPDDANKPALSNLPFECCIMEYGVRWHKDEGTRSKENGLMGAWRRSLAMFGTTIV